MSVGLTDDIYHHITSWCFHFHYILIFIRFLRYFDALLVVLQVKSDVCVTLSVIIATLLSNVSYIFV